MRSYKILFVCVSLYAVVVCVYMYLCEYVEARAGYLPPLSYIFETVYLDEAKINSV